MVCLNVHIHGSRFIKTIITLLASTIRCPPILCLNVYLHGSRFIKTIVTLLTSIRFLPMLCLNVKLHSSRFCKAIVTFLWSLMLLLSTLADTSNSMSAIVVENVSMDCHILHTTLVDISNSMPATFVTKFSLVSQISDCILVYMIHIRLHGCHSCRKCFNGLIYLTHHIISHISLMLVRNVIRVSLNLAT